MLVHVVTIAFSTRMNRSRRRKMREVYESIRMLFGDVKEEYMANVVSTVEALIAIEGPARRSQEEDTQSVIELDFRY